jgi:hypothetical protein
MDQKELIKRLKRIGYTAKNLLAAFELNKKRYIRRRLRQLIALNGILSEKAGINGQQRIISLSQQIGAELSKIQGNIDNYSECMKYVGIIVKLCNNLSINKCKFKN